MPHAEERGGTQSGKHLDIHADLTPVFLAFVGFFGMRRLAWFRRDGKGTKGRKGDRSNNGNKEGDRSSNLFECGLGSLRGKPGNQWSDANLERCSFSPLNQLRSA
jgi:hypothetical protein